MVILGTKHLE